MWALCESVYLCVCVSTLSLNVPPSLNSFIVLQFLPLSNPPLPPPFVASYFPPSSFLPSPLPLTFSFLSPSSLSFLPPYQPLSTLDADNRTASQRSRNEDKQEQMILEESDHMAVMSVHAFLQVRYTL